MEDETPIFNGPVIHILPDTCVELVIHFSDPYKTTFSNQSTSIQQTSFVVGQMKNFMKIEPHGKTGFIAVRFTALGAHHFFGMPMKEMANGETGLKSVWKDLAPEIDERIHFAQSTAERARIIQHYLKTQLSQNGHVDKAISFAIFEIKRTQGALPIDTLASQIGMSTRQLVRRFDQRIGVSPKEFARITKFIGALDRLNSSRNKSLTEVALDSGYYDQAHFIHDFREYSGMTPGDYLSTSNVVY